MIVLVVLGLIYVMSFAGGIAAAVAGQTSAGITGFVIAAVVGALIAAVLTLENPQPAPQDPLDDV